MEYLKTGKLNRAYRVLHDADSSVVAVKEVALDCGFTHFGQFGQNYKKLFGELPSETLQS